ncbi:MAG TPA: hypothetical protein VMZ51_08145 [Acidimicrobiales bacterium]|nr:hypothetical protein [Acidimicrobiales bacterium]
MTTGTMTPEVDRRFVDVDRQIEDIHRHLLSLPSRSTSLEQDDVVKQAPTDGQVLVWSAGLWRPKDRLVGIVFVFGSSTTPVAVSTSTDVPAIANMEIVDAVADLKTAGSSSTVATIYKNGASIGTVTLVSSDTNETDPLTLTTFTADVDGVGCGITTAGTGALGLTVLVRGRLLG